MKGKVCAVFNRISVTFKMIMKLAIGFIVIEKDCQIFKRKTLSASFVS